VLKANPDKYEIKEEWFTTDACTNSWHCHIHIGLPSTYHAKLCKFWKGVFDYDATCDDFPKYDEGKVKAERLYTSMFLRLGDVPGPVLGTVVIGFGSTGLLIMGMLVSWRALTRRTGEMQTGTTAEMSADTLELAVE